MDHFIRLMPKDDQLLFTEESLKTDLPGLYEFFVQQYEPVFKSAVTSTLDLRFDGNRLADFVEKKLQTFEQIGHSFKSTLKHLKFAVSDSAASAIFEDPMPPANRSELLSACNRFDLAESLGKEVFRADESNPPIEDDRMSIDERLDEASETDHTKQSAANQSENVELTEPENVEPNEGENVEPNEVENEPTEADNVELSEQFEGDEGNENEDLLMNDELDIGDQTLIRSGDRFQSANATAIEQSNLSPSSFAFSFSN